jgi:hypothetical protein
VILGSGFEFSLARSISKAFTTEAQRHRENRTNKQLRAGVDASRKINLIGGFGRCGAYLPFYNGVPPSPTPLDIWNHRLEHVLARRIRQTKDLEVKI